MSQTTKNLILLCTSLGIVMFLWLQWVNRFEVHPGHVGGEGIHAQAYILDRWTGEIQFCGGPQCLPIGPAKR